MIEIPAVIAGAVPDIKIGDIAVMPRGTPFALRLDGRQRYKAESLIRTGIDIPKLNFCPVSRSVSAHINDLAVVHLAANQICAIARGRKPPELIHGAAAGFLCGENDLCPVCSIAAADIHDLSVNTAFDVIISVAFAQLPALCSRSVDMVQNDRTVAAGMVECCIPCTGGNDRKFFVLAVCVQLRRIRA